MIWDFHRSSCDPEPSIAFNLHTWLLYNEEEKYAKKTPKLPSFPGRAWCFLYKDGYKTTP